MPNPAVSRTFPAMPLHPECRPLPGGFQLDAYRIDRMLSKGGFSLVYLATDGEGTPVVIKEYLPANLAGRQGDDPAPTVAPENQAKFRKGMRSFLEEARLLARISHPNVVAVLNFFMTNNTAYIVMRHESGQSLHDYVSRLKGRGEAIAEAFVRGVFVRLLAGLREVHRQKLLHLDLKPANIYLRSDGNPVLLDFGAARWGLGEGDPSLGQVFTPGFAAPEQQGSGEALGPWTDIYAIGATLYSCLDGGQTPMPARLRQEQDGLERAEDRWASRYSPQLLEVIDWCLRLPATTRPQSVYALQKVLNGELLDIVDPSWFDT